LVVLWVWVVVVAPLAARVAMHGAKVLVAVVSACFLVHPLARWVCLLERLGLLRFLAALIVMGLIVSLRLRQLRCLLLRHRPHLRLRRPRLFLYRRHRRLRLSRCCHRLHRRVLRRLRLRVRRLLRFLFRLVLARHLRLVARLRRH
jgi:hypothetical protein